MDLQERVSEWSARHQPAIAIFLALAVGVAATLGAVFVDPLGSERPSDFLVFVLIWATAACVFFYRTKPRSALLVAGGLLLVQWVLDYPVSNESAIWILFYATTRYGGDERNKVWTHVLVVMTALTITALVGVLVPTEDLPAIAIIAIPLTFGIFAAAGEATYQRFRYLQQLKQRAAALEADLESKAALAAVEERTRIARDMHDIIAHGMSTVVVQAQAAQSVVDTDPAKAREVLRTIENIGRSSVDEMRRMLGVLRREDADTEREPQPGLGELESLRRQVEVAGVDLELKVTGEHHNLPPGLELTGYRIVQEALTNVLRHAGRPVRVTAVVDFTGDELLIDVVDDGLGAAATSATSGSGHGLLGIRERVEIYNGSVTAGPVPGGGFGVHAKMPLPARLSA